MPVLEATAPMQVWTWDITELPGPFQSVTYHLYVAMDLFSRQIVASRIEDREDKKLARDMFTAAFAHYGAHPTVVHSDGGASMMSETMADLYSRLGITRSRSRPGVSNDNPFSEAGHKTLKYWHAAPRHFTSIEHARTWFTTVIDAYNTTHHHTGLAGHTPASVHDGTWKHIHTARQHTLDQLYRANPARYHTPPTAQAPYARVGINTKKTKDRLTTD
ncbi:MAG: DDE-type integrase/transposase/recombinase [bacterium]|nr:DDE-type integrase/transposase/recombinase [bacterium]